MYKRQPEGICHIHQHRRAVGDDADEEKAREELVRCNRVVPDAAYLAHAVVIYAEGGQREEDAVFGIDAVIYAVKLLVQQAGHVGADKQRDYKVKDIQQSFVYAVTGK